MNAFGHRDYTLLGRVRVQLDDAGLTIANPGGFVEGINIHNLLTAEPHGRNPCLMDALKRTGLAERAGRGIDRICEGSLHYGRPLPDYTASNERNVSVYLQRSAPDVEFVRMLAEEQERTGKTMPVNGLLILNMLRNERRCTFETMNKKFDMSEQRLRAMLGQLTESGMIKGSGNGSRRTYTLGSTVYRRTGKTIEYVRQTGIDRVRWPELIMKLVAEQNDVTRADVMELLHVDANQAYYQLSKLVKGGKLRVIGRGKGGALYDRWLYRVKVMCWRMCLYGCFVLGIVRTWEVVSALRKVPRNLGSGVGKVPRFRYAFVWRSSEGSGGTFALGRPVFAAMRLRYGGWDCCEPKRKNCAEHTRGTTPWALRPSPPAHHPPPATRLREAKAFPNHIAARVAP